MSKLSLCFDLVYSKQIIAQKSLVKGFLEVVSKVLIHNIKSYSILANGRESNMKSLRVFNLKLW